MTDLNIDGVKVCLRIYIKKIYIFNNTVYPENVKINYKGLSVIKEIKY